MKTIGFYVSVGLGLLLAFAALQTPKPMAANDANNRFSASRALIDIKEIARAPHEIGSVEHARVGEYLKSRFESMGLETEFSSGTGLDQSDDIEKSSQTTSSTIRFAITAPVTNIIATIKGVDRSAPAVLVMSHYDSVALSPGAADDASGVAASLEVARLLKSGPQPQRDVIFLLSDGEEAGLLGAELFFSQHSQKSSLAKHIGVVVNMETRGDSGLASMFETGPKNADLIALYAKAAHNPSANSLSGAVYKRMPNGTDFTHASKLGIMGLNFAFVGNELAYHTPLATPEHLNLGSVQHMGNQVWPVVDALAHAKSLPVQSQDSVYSDIFGKVLIHYSINTGGVILGIIALMIACIFWLGLRGAGFKFNVQGLKNGAQSTFGVVALMLAPIVLLWPLGALLGQISHEQRLPNYAYLFAGCVIAIIAVTALVAQGLQKARQRLALIIGVVIVSALGNAFGLDLVAIGLGLVMGLAILALGKASLSGVNLWRASLVINLIMAVIVQVSIPEATPVIVWPLGMGALSALISLSALRLKPRLLRALQIAIAALTIGFVSALGKTLFDALGVDMPIVIAGLVMIILPVIMPLMVTEQPSEAEYETKFPVLSYTLLGLGLVSVFYARFAPPTRPEPVSILHVHDLDKAKAYRMSEFRRMDAWTRAALSQQGDKVSAVEYSAPSAGGSKRWWAKDAVVSVKPVDIKIERGGDYVTIVVKPQEGLSRLRLEVKSNVILEHVALNGRELKGQVSPNVETQFIALASNEGMRLRFLAPVHGKIEAVVETRRPQWPQGIAPIVAVDKNHMAVEQHATSVTKQKRVIEW